MELRLRGDGASRDCAEASRDVVGIIDVLLDLEDAVDVEAVFVNSADDDGNSDAGPSLSRTEQLVESSIRG